MDFYLTTEYQNWLAEIKNRIVASRVRAAISANSELIRLYYDLGAQIVERELTAKWGSAFIDSFSRDLKKAFPEMTGFSPQNLRYCRAFYRFYRADEICQQSVGEMDGTDYSALKEAAADQIPWGHNILIFTKSADRDEALFYIAQTINNGWSREVLAQQIKSNLYIRAGKVISNFEQTLPAPPPSFPPVRRRPRLHQKFPCLGT